MANDKTIETLRQVRAAVSQQIEALNGVGQVESDEQLVSAITCLDDALKAVEHALRIEVGAK